MTYILWDKQSPIYDITAEQAIANNPKYRNENSYIFYNDDGGIRDLLALSMRPNPDGLTNPDEICTAFIARLTAPKPAPPDEIGQLKTQVAQLQADNAAILFMLLTGGTMQ